MMIRLSQIAAVARQAGLPRDKTALIKALEKSGARRDTGRLDDGQTGFLYRVDTLPKPLADLVRRRRAQAQGGSGADPELWERYYRAPRSRKDDAERRLVMVRRVAELVEAGSTKTDAFAQVADDHGVSPGTVKNAWRKVKPHDRADWLPALVKQNKGRQREPLHPEIERFFFGFYGRPEQPQFRHAYEQTCLAAEHNGWGRVPSLKTLKRRWDRLPAPTKAYWRGGDKALDGCIPLPERDPIDLAVLERVYIDTRTLDILVKAGPDGRRIADVTGFEDTPPAPGVIRIACAMAIDARSRYLIAWEFAETESSDLYRRLLSGVCEVGCPQEFWFDNTRAAGNKALTAGARTRFRFTERPDDVPGILTRLGIEPHFILPRNGRSNPVERAHGEIKERAEKSPKLAGAYAGRSPVEKPANYGERPAALETVKECFAEAAHHYRTRADRRGLAACNTSYQAVFEEGLRRAPPRKLSETQRLYFFLLAKRCLVSGAGEVFLGTKPRLNRFHSRALQGYAGQHIIVRYDPENLSAPVMAETEDGRLIDPAVPCLERLGFKTRDEGREFQRQRRAAIRAEKEAANARGKMDALELTRVLPDPTPPDSVSPKVVAPQFALRLPKPAEPGVDFEKLSRGAELLKRASGDGCD